MAEQAAGEMQRLALGAERQSEIEHDMIVVARVERHPIAGTGGSDTMYDVERVVAVEGRHLDADDVVDPGEFPPERFAEGYPTDGGLQIEADHRNFGGDLATMVDQLLLAGATHRGQADQHGVIAEGTGRLRFAHCLDCPPDDTGDQHQWPVGPVPS